MGKTRRGVLGLLVVTGLLKAGSEVVQNADSNKTTDDVNSGDDSNNKLELEETQDLDLTELNFYSEKFQLKGDARIEYEINVIEGGIETRVFQDRNEYERFKQAAENNDYTKGDYVEECFSGVNRGDRTESCIIESPDESQMYEMAIVCMPTLPEQDTTGTLTYRLFV